MRLALKLIAALTCAIFLVLGVNALVRVEREATLFQEDIRRDGRVLGRAIAGAAARIWTTVGEIEALDLVRDADRRAPHMNLRWLWIDATGEASDQPAISPESRRLLEAGEVAVFKRHSRDGKEGFLYTLVPIALPIDRLAVIEVRESLAAERHYVRGTMFQAAVTTGTLVLLCGVLTTAIGIFFVGRPVRRLVEQARRIGLGDLSPERSPPRKDEIGALAQEMNAMCARLLRAREKLAAETAALLATQEQLRHADRLNTVGKLAAGIAHEVGTPLNVITGYCQLVRDDYAPGTPTHENVLIIAEQAQRVADIIRQLLDFSRQRTLYKQSVDLGGLAEQVVSLLESLAHKQKVTIELALPAKPIRSEIDAGQIQQVLTNLIVNGIHAMKSGGQLAVVIERADRAPPGRSDAAEQAFGRISIRDSGTGIPEKALPRIFEPFFTTKDIGEGTGLGLSVAYGIVNEHGGWIEVETELDQGSCFTVWLPAKAEDE